MSEKITIEDVAKKCEVAPSTVSRVFNNKGRIADATKEKVLKVAEEMGFRPRKYTKKKTKVKNINIVFVKSAVSGNPNPFYGPVMKGLEKSLKKRNFNLLFNTISENAHPTSDTVNTIINSESSGIILVGCGINKKIITKIKRAGKPLVLLDNEIWDEDINCIINDNIAGARKVVKYLTDLGHREIGFIGGPLSHISFDQRYIGYKKALKDAGIKKNDKYIRFCQPEEEYSLEGYEVTKKLLNNINDIPTAFFVANDELAVGVLKAIKRNGYKVPGDISIVGFDDIDMARHTSPPLTTVKIFKERMGIHAGKRLVELINKEFIEAIKLVLSVKLIKRESTCPPKL
ncbi:MAG: LacI family DNA-binding transcriptional regulator [Halanaerobiaceae bacterium]